MKLCSDGQREKITTDVLLTQRREKTLFTKLKSWLWKPKSTSPKWSRRMWTHSEEWSRVTGVTGHFWSFWFFSGSKCSDWDSSSLLGFELQLYSNTFSFLCHVYRSNESASDRVTLKESDCSFKSGRQNEAENSSLPTRVCELGTLMNEATESEDQRRLRRKPAGGKRHQTPDREDPQQTCSFHTQTQLTGTTPAAQKPFKIKFTNFLFSNESGHTVKTSEISQLQRLWWC